MCSELESRIREVNDELRPYQSLEYASPACHLETLGMGRRISWHEPVETIECMMLSGVL